MILQMMILMLLHLQSLWTRSRTKNGVVVLGYQSIAIKELNILAENFKFLLSLHLLLYIQIAQDIPKPLEEMQCTEI